VAGGSRPEIFPPFGFAVLIVVGTIAAVVLALTLVPWLHGVGPRLRRHDLVPHDRSTALLGLVVFGYTTAYLLASFFGIPMYDRYVLPVVPLVAILLLRPAAAVATGTPARTKGPRRPALAGTAALVVLAFVGAVFTADSAAFDGARWQTAVAATEKGWSRRQIRGGFEWANFYGSTRVSQQKQYCVAISVNTKRQRDDPLVVAWLEYDSPLRKPVPVAAIRSKLDCKPARRLERRP
jgi:hypothetical protein